VVGTISLDWFASDLVRDQFEGFYFGRVVSASPMSGMPQVFRAKNILLLRKNVP
jgi:hypothetical protein